MVICEELNATFSKLRRYWSTIRTSGDPQLSPAVEGFQDLLFMGRAVQIHVLAITQMATAKDLGGPEARENFVVRILARYTPNAWKMLVPEITYRPAPTIPGRVMVCRSGPGDRDAGRVLRRHRGPGVGHLRARGRRRSMSQRLRVGEPLFPRGNTLRQSQGRPI